MPNGRITRPIVSDRQRRFFYAEANKPASERKTDMSYVELQAHLKDVEGKKLPKRVRRKK
jgi:hypothetical protein